MPCYRVPIRYFRDGIIVERDGPIIDAPGSVEAVDRAEELFRDRRTYAGVGSPVILHDGHHARRGLYRMVAQIRARRQAS